MTPHPEDAISRAEAERIERLDFEEAERQAERDNALAARQEEPICRDCGGSLSVSCTCFEEHDNQAQADQMNDSGGES